MIQTDHYFAKIILPLKFERSIFYKIPPALKEDIRIGSRVSVIFAHRVYIGVVCETSAQPDIDIGKIKEITSVVENFPDVGPDELNFWKWISSYYLCTIGEVYKAAFPATMYKVKTEKLTFAKMAEQKEREVFIKLNEAQQIAFDSTLNSFEKRRTVLLKGVTGSGKTEIYIKLIQNCLESGKSALYLVPEVAISRQIESRLDRHLGRERVAVYHSKKTIKERVEIQVALTYDSSPILIFGTRSSIFLPFKNLGLIIVDEEHDSSYKQIDPAPRYSAKDSALILARQHNANIVLGTSTPSFESLYNVSNNKFDLVELSERYHQAPNAKVTIIEMSKEQRRGRIIGELSQTLIDRLSDILKNREQALIIQNNWSHSTQVQCNNCGYIPKCSRCNIALTYQKTKQLLTCNYCGHSESFTNSCNRCDKGTITSRSTATEKVERVLKQLFPDAVIARFDQESISSKIEERRILREFSENKINIIVGTQMISKGFDFEHLSLSAIIDADSLFYGEDFRASEKAFQLLKQLSGRSGRKQKGGEIIIQTRNSSHPIYRHLINGDEIAYSILDERRDFNYPPFSRIVVIELRCSDQNRLKRASTELMKRAERWNLLEICGPFKPLGEKKRGKFSERLLLKLNRHSNINTDKENIWGDIKKIEESYPSIVIQCIVDPL